MALREIFADLGFTWDSATPARADKQVKGLEASVQGLVAVFAGNALLGAVQQFAGELDVLDDLSAQTRIATGDLQELGFAASLAGSSQQEMFASLERLQKSLGDTTEGTGDQIEAFKSLGIQLKTATGEQRELSDILPEVFANFSGLESSARKAEVATALFGRAGVRLIPTLEKGSAGLEDIRKQLDEVGGVISEDTIAAAGGFKDSVARMDRAWFAFKGTLAQGAFPMLEKTTTALAKGVGAINKFVDGTTLADTATLGLAAALAGPLLSALAPFLIPGLKFAAIFLAVDDVMAFLQGKESVIGDLLNAAFGDGTADEVRAWANDAIDSLQRFHASADETFAAIADDSSTSTQAALASFVAFIRDASAGFPAMGAMWRSTMSGMYAALLEFIAMSMAQWNGFVMKLQIPPALKAAIGAISPTAGAALAAAEAAAPSAQLDPTKAMAASIRERQLEADARDEALASLQGWRSNTIGTPLGGDNARTFIASRRDALAFPGAPLLPSREAVGAASTVPTAPLPGLGGAGFIPAPAGAGVTVNQQNPINVNIQAPPGSSAEDVARIAGAEVRRAAAEGDRQARQALAQRGAK